MLHSAKEKTVVIAHRGGAGLFEENTLDAFRKVQELGVDAMECDVHLTADGHLVVLHDPDLERVAGIRRKVSEMTLAEVKQVRLKGGSEIPTLDEVLEKTSIHIVIELKDASTVMAITELLEKHPEYLKRCAVICFYHRAVLMLKEKFPDLETGALLAGFPVDPVSVALAARTETLALYYEGLTADYVSQCHDGGIQVSVWTPNAEEEIREMIDIGVDAIATDRPDIALRLTGRQ